MKWVQQPQKKDVGDWQLEQHTLLLLFLALNITFGFARAL